MSTSLAYATPLRRPRELEPVHLVPVPQRIRVVTTRAQRRARPKLVYALGATVVIFAIFLTQLLITIALSSGAYKIDDLQLTQQSLGRTTSSLNERLNTLGSSQNLEANALALGMVASSQAAFLQLSDGAVLGSAAAAATTAAPITESNGSTDGIANSLLSSIPLIKSTGAGHGDANAPVSTSNNSESTEGTATASSGSTVPASAPSNPGELPSPVTN